MDVKSYRSMTSEQRKSYARACATYQNVGAMMELSAFEKYLDKQVITRKGRKVPIGTVGTCFWVGMRNYSKYGNWWSWEVHIGLRGTDGQVYFTAEDNIERIDQDGRTVQGL